VEAGEETHALVEVVKQVALVVVVLAHHFQVVLEHLGKVLLVGVKLLQMVTKVVAVVALAQ